MRSILGFGVVLAAVGLTAAVGTAYGQTGAGGQAGRGASGIGGQAASTAVNNVEQQVTGAAATTPAVPGQVVTNPAQPGAVTTTAPNAFQAPGTAGTVVNPRGRRAP